MRLSRRLVLTSVALSPIAVLAACADTDNAVSGPTSAPPDAPSTTASSTTASGADPTQVGEAYGVSSADLAFTVHQSPTCGCCHLWMEYAEPHGLALTSEFPTSMETVFTEHNVPRELQSCHLAVNAAGVMVIGHMPVRFIGEFLKARTEDEIAISVPGMPIGSPGMESGNDFEPYDVLVLSSDGSTRVLAHVATAADQLI